MNLVQSWAESIRRQQFERGMLQGMLEGSAFVYGLWQDWNENSLQPRDPPELPDDFDPRDSSRYSLTRHIPPNVLYSAIRVFCPGARRFYRDAVNFGRTDGMRRAHGLCTEWYEARQTGDLAPAPWLAMPRARLILRQDSADSS